MTQLRNKVTAVPRPSSYLAPQWFVTLIFSLAMMASQFLLPSHLLAQAGSSDVLGTVTDSSGAVVVGAKVTIKDLGTSATRVATTDSNGGERTTDPVTKCAAGLGE